jgi:hypothetical protein
MSAYRDDVTALSARHDALATEVEHKTRELEQATRMLDEAKARARLPILDNIRVASPCPAEWSSMVGDERVRHCGDCKKNVYNLSGMTREEAETLILAKAGNLCVRYFQRKDGTILTADCAVGVSRGRKRKLIAVGAAAMLAAGSAGIALRMAAPDDDEVLETAGMMEVRGEPMIEVRGVMEPAPAPVELEHETIIIRHE